MNKPVLLPLEQSKSVYKALRDIRDAAAGIEIHAVHADSERVDSYSKLLLAVRCVESLRESLWGQDFWSQDSEVKHHAKDALDHLLELELLLAARVMTLKSEDIVLAFELAECEVQQAKSAA